MCRHPGARLTTGARDARLAHRVRPRHSVGVHRAHVIPYARGHGHLPVLPGRARQGRRLGNLRAGAAPLARAAPHLIKLLNFS